MEYHLLLKYLNLAFNYFAFNFLIPKKRKVKASKVDKTSAIGKENHIPLRSKDRGSKSIKGIKKIPCFESVNNNAGFGFPIA